MCNVFFFPSLKFTGVFLLNLTSLVVTARQCVMRASLRVHVCLMSALTNAEVSGWVCACSGRGRRSCAVSLGDCSNQIGVLIRVCSSGAWWGAMRAVDCNVMLLSVSLKNAETNRQENHDHTDMFCFVVLSPHPPQSTSGTPRQTGKV